MKSTYSWLLFCVQLLVPSNGRRFRCDYKYFQNIDGWLKVHQIPANWREARLRCHLEGGNIASPLNPALKDNIEYMMKTNNVTYGVFTGIHATFSRGDFFSIEGVPLRKITHTWAKDQPDNVKDEESCLLLLPEGTVADVACTDTFPYICYKKNTSGMMVNYCGTVDIAYTLDARTGSCYKFHKTPRTWSRAYMTCAAEGGYLAILNSETEAQVIREIFSKNPPASITGTRAKDFSFIGFHDWSEHGEWLTIQGHSLQEAGYDKFAPGNPDNATTGEFCGSVFRSALLNDLWCENKYTFICEKSPDSLLCDDDKK